jgi:catechol 2,3-dioxygenase-like lactoylglutathione lyase family enzyme
LVDDAPALSGTHHVALTVTDLGASLRWYREVLGFERVPHLDYDHPHGGGRAAVTVQPGSGTVLVLHHHDANGGERFAESRTGLDHVCFRVPDRESIEAWERRFEQLGVDHSPVAEQSGALFLVFRDPDDIQLELGTAD